jgi:dolichol-phosphate mannosyltransferase
MKLSIVIPAYNEEGSIVDTINELYAKLVSEGIDHEIFVVNDNSKDSTLHILENLKKDINTLVYETNQGPNGFGYAVRYGLEKFSGDCVAIMMADLSDDPNDLIKFYRVMQAGDWDCVFGNRWTKGGHVYDYPRTKKIVNRIANLFVATIVGIKYTDTTNAFKLYKRKTILGLKPFIAPHFNLTLELPLKAIVRGYTYAVIPNSWRNRQTGVSKLKMREMGSRYFFILAYCIIEKFFAKGDFNKKWD